MKLTMKRIILFTRQLDSAALDKQGIAESPAQQREVVVPRLGEFELGSCPASTLAQQTVDVLAGLPPDLALLIVCDQFPVCLEDRR